MKRLLFMLRLLEQRRKSTNHFSEFLNQTMQAANLTHKPMTNDEAFKILQLKANKTNAEEILKIYWRQFHKNDSVKGGLFYIQQIVHNAKCELMKDFPDFNEKIRKEEEKQIEKTEEVVKYKEQKEN